MDATLPFLLLLVLPTMAAAFTAQLALSPAARHRVRRWTAGLWVAAIALVTSWDEGAGSILGLVLYTAMTLGIAFLVAYCGALTGSIAALRLRLFVGRRASRA
jgi:hypothetical protein